MGHGPQLRGELPGLPVARAGRQRLDPAIYGRRHYGWVVEIDPFDKTSPVRKHTAMGRFRHENVAIRVAGDGTVVAYMGDDLADFSDAAWILLDYASSQKIRDAKTPDGTPLFTGQVDVLADARAAALAAGGTPVDRPEDIEVNPRDGSVFVALTNNTGHGNFHGQIVRIEETDGAPAATTFSWSIFAVGGPQSGFSSPDNLIFDAGGGLWMVTDISSSRLGKGIYAFQGNKRPLLPADDGQQRRHGVPVRERPGGVRDTGPAWTPDGGTLFLSVQHPGENSESAASPSSRWPNGGNDVPRPASVAITGPWGRYGRGRY